MRPHKGETQNHGFRIRTGKPYIHLDHLPVARRVNRVAIPAPGNGAPGLKTKLNAGSYVGAQTAFCQDRAPSASSAC